MSGRVGSITTPIITDGLVFNLDAANRASYPKTGTIWNDTINGNNGTLTNGPTFSEDGGGSIVFDYVNDYVISENNISTLLNDGESFTLSTWYKSTDNTFGFYVALAFGNYLNYFLIEVYNSNTVNSLIRLNRRKSVSGVGYVTEILSTNNTHNVWNNITAILTDNGGTLKLYLNGVLADSLVTTIDLEIPAFPIMLGDSNPFAYYWAGNIANTQIYNKELTPSEVLHNYNALKGRFGL